ncbi:hypothetical protein M378DRAFT_165751 [Amanita muscaria Koide BX008]|uniref:Uncharacterized protein n=1 Tax=Amanita muscaria (strain Koide BX008) TaxID=946122 RepID=A0A0C2X124_AMAMK|nr:hypothetical protein M378DRAFT_165751 [Amanita muscaria Koide BX008]
MLITNEVKIRNQNYPDTLMGWLHSCSFPPSRAGHTLYAAIIYQRFKADYLHSL